jgi:UDP-N-acetylmuramoyl-L-alanyl-D-glutamate--2,6-diaminopimelate ligase
LNLSHLIQGAPNAEVTGITADSRRVKPGDLFAALQGVAGDGRDYVEQAIRNGAVAILTDARPGEFSVPTVRAENARLALSIAASKMWPQPPATIAAVTGTNGKSSTVDFLRQIWTRLGKRAASMGTLGAIGPRGRVDLGHTTPDPVAIHQTLSKLLGDGVSHVAVEASSHGLAQFRLDGVKLAAGAFSNLTQDHLDYHPDFDDYRRAKLRLFTDLLPKGAPACINADSAERPVFEAAAREAGLKPFTFGWKGDHLWFDEIIPRGTAQDLVVQWEVAPGQDAERRIKLPLIGEFQALNALAAAAVAMSLGDDAEKVLEALEHLEGVPGRLELVGQTHDKAPVFVDYAHTPDGLDTLLRAARPHVRGKIVLVFGCGGDRDTKKRPLMGEVARRFADDVIVTDDNPRSENPEAIRAAILKAVPDASEIGDRAEAIAEGVRRLRPGDALLIAGKGHETGQIIGSRTLPFNDASVARAAIADAGGDAHG